MLIVWRLPLASTNENSFLRLSLPLINGVRKRNRHLATGQRRADQRTKCLGAIRIAPTKIVKDRDSRWISAHRDAIADRFVNRAGRHVVRVPITVVRVHTAAHGHAPPGIESGTDDGRVARSVVGRADQRLDYTAGLDFVVVLANDPFFGGDVERGEDLMRAALPGWSRAALRIPSRARPTGGEGT